MGFPEQIYNHSELKRTRTHASFPFHMNQTPASHKLDICVHPDFSFTRTFGVLHTSVPHSQTDTASM